MKMCAQKLLKITLVALLSGFLLTACDSSNTELPYLGWGMGSSSYRYYSNSIWSAISQHFELNHHTHNSDVKTQIRWMQQHQEIVYNSLQAAAPYIYYINQQTTQRGLPGELALLPLIESGFNPHALSHAGASGLWQLMPHTATGLGIKMDRAYDGRRDIIASTNAALDYLNYLHQYFNNNWELAIAAYDCGAGNMQNAMHSARTTNYWKLPLPSETRAYLPKLLALAAIIQNPARYHMQLPPITNAPYLAVVKVDSKTNLAKVAKNAGVNIATLKSLNPGYNQLITSGNAPHYLLVPIAKLDDIKASLVHSPNTTTQPMIANTNIYYSVKKGDTLSKIAREHHISMQSLIAANHLNNNSLLLNQKLQIPNNSSTILAHNTSKHAVDHPQKILTYTVQAGDSLYRIASHYKTTVAALQRWNSLSANDISAGQQLKIYLNHGY